MRANAPHTGSGAFFSALRQGVYSFRIGAVGDLEALDDRYYYFFRLYRSEQPPCTALRKRASLGYLRWQRAAHCSRPHGGNGLLNTGGFLGILPLSFLSIARIQEEL